MNATRFPRGSERSVLASLLSLALVAAFVVFPYRASADSIDEKRRQAAAIADQLENLVDQMNSLGEDYSESLVEQADLAVEIEQAQADVAAGTGWNLYLGLAATTVSVYAVRGNGDVVNTNGSYGAISDAKMKTDIVDAGSQWEDIKAIRFRKFKMKDDPAGLVQLGVVAQELEQTSPGLVDEAPDRDVKGNDLGTTTKSVKTSVLLMKAAVALQEAMARIETLEAKVALLEPQKV